jgi:anti-anti-sigma factor
LAAGGLVLATLLVLAPVFSSLPKAVLGAVIIDAVVFGMIDVAELRRLRRIARFDFAIALAAIVGVLSAGVLAGVVIGVALSLIWLVRVATSPAMPVLGRQPGTGVFRELGEHPGDDTLAGVVTLRLDGGLFFATADALEERVRELTDGATRALIVDFRGVNFIDSQGAERLTGILELLQSRGATLRLAQVRPHVLRLLRADGFVDRVDAGHIHATLDLAMRAEQARASD